MKVKRIPIKQLSLNKRKVGLTAAMVMKIHEIKATLARALAARKIFLVKKDFYQGKIRRINRFIYILANQDISLAFYDDSELTSTYNQRRIRINDFEETLLHATFRFRTHHQLRRIIQCLNIPNVVRLDDGSLTTSEEMLLVSLYRLHLPLTYAECQEKFGINYATCSRIFNFFITFLVEHWGYLLVDNMNYWWPLFPSFADSIQQRIHHLNLVSTSNLFIY